MQAMLMKPEGLEARCLREEVPKGARVKVIICEKQMVIK